MSPCNSCLLSIKGHLLLKHTHSICFFFSIIPPVHNAAYNFRLQAVLFLPYKLMAGRNAFSYGNKSYSRYCLYSFDYNIVTFLS